ncbi:MAG: DUF3422 family protein [Candidatus Hydrothermarchaeota archaeon]
MNVKVYSLSTCPYCRLVESFLNTHGVKYERIMIDELKGEEQKKAIAEAYRLSGQRSFPVTRINEKTIIGFDESMLTKALGLKEKEVDLSTRIDEEKKTDIQQYYDLIRKDAEKTGYILNPNREFVDMILLGLLENRERYGYATCPCRLASGKIEEDNEIICPCTNRDLYLQRYDRCLCGLYVTENYNPYDPTSPFCLAEYHEEMLEHDVSTPTYVKVFGYSMMGVNEESIKNNFKQVVSSCELNPEYIRWREKDALISKIFEDRYRVTLKMNISRDFYTYQVWAISVKESPSEIFNLIDLFASLDFSWNHNQLFALDILLNEKDFFDENLDDLLPKSDRVGSKLRDGIWIMTSDQEKRIGRERYIVTPIRGDIVEDIITIESSYHLLNLEKQKYTLISDRLSRIEDETVSKLGSISISLPKASHELLKDWMHEISNSFSEIAGITEEVNHHYLDATSHRDSLKSIFEEWNESTIDNLPLISSSILSKVRDIERDYERLYNRIDGIRKEMEDTINILRTKIDLIQQKQSFDLQKSMHVTTQTQLDLQKAVKGVYVFLVAFYFTELARIVFEAMEARGIIHIAPSIPTALFIPVALFLGWLLSMKTEKLIRRKREH